MPAMVGLSAFLLPSRYTRTTAAGPASPTATAAGSRLSAQGLRAKSSRATGMLVSAAAGPRDEATGMT